MAQYTIYLVYVLLCSSQCGVSVVTNAHPIELVVNCQTRTLAPLPRFWMLKLLLPASNNPPSFNCMPMAVALKRSACTLFTLPSALSSNGAAGNMCKSASQLEDTTQFVALPSRQYRDYFVCNSHSDLS